VVIQSLRDILIQCCIGGRSELTPSIACRTRSLSITPLRCRLFTSSSLDVPELRQAIFENWARDDGPRRRERKNEEGVRMAEVMMQTTVGRTMRAALRLTRMQTYTRVEIFDKLSFLRLHRLNKVILIS
jgi:hypothetical protein